jgi:hypothetical protein
MKTDQISRKKQAFQALLIYTSLFFIPIVIALLRGNAPNNFYTMIGIMYGIFVTGILVYVWGLIVLEKIISKNFIPEMFHGQLLTKEESEAYAIRALPDVQGK